MNEILRAKLRDLPSSPGVYFHKSKSGEIIYVGKAAVLKNRVRQYFQASRNRDPKTEALVAEIFDTDWMVVDSEVEALFLESEMIRRYMPRFNILLRDDKSLSYIRIDYDSDFPTVSTTRRPLDDGARYFGPYFSLLSVRQALKILRRIFPFATRRIVGQKRATLHYHLGLDPGLEEGRTSLEDYRSNLRKLMAVIEGKRSVILKEIEHDMKRAARASEFEVAAKLRNQLFALQNLSRQIVFSDKEFLDISKDQALAGLVKLFELPAFPKRIEGFDISHMQGTDVVASMVVFTNGVSDKSEYRKFKTSERSDDANNIYETVFRRFSETNVKKWGTPNLLLIDGGIPQLNAAIRAQRARGMSVPVVSIAKNNDELVVAQDGSNVSTINLVTDSTKFVRRDSNYFFVNLHPGQYKSSGHSPNLRGRRSTYKYDDVVMLVQRIRDESHRFAVSYHSALKVKHQTSSILDEIPGVGPVTHKKLIKAFGSLRGILGASGQDLAKLVGRKQASIIVRYLEAAKSAPDLSRESL